MWNRESFILCVARWEWYDWRYAYTTETSWPLYRAVIAAIVAACVCQLCSRRGWRAVVVVLELGALIGAIAIVLPVLQTWYLRWIGVTGF